MTESEWLNCDDPHALLDAIRDVASERKLRLFAASALWPHTALSKATANATVIEEIFETAEGTLTRQDLRRLRDKVGTWSVSGLIPTEINADLITRAAGLILSSDSLESASRMISAVRYLETARAFPSPEDRRRCDDRLVCEIRDIFGHPFKSVGIVSQWRTSTTIALSRQMYESRDFSAMPILADALQDAGCECQEVLTHCRDPEGIHVRGCWVVDLILGKS